MESINNFQALDSILENIRKGAFLTVKNRHDELNTMTIGWVMFGILWRKPILMVAVRPNRYTFQLIEKANDFTVTFPFSDMREQLNFCGVHSGRNMNKFKECGLVTQAAKKVNSPIVVAKAARYYECQIVQATAMDKEGLNQKYDKDVYQDKSYHTYYFGEIVACYEA